MERKFNGLLLIALYVFIILAVNLLSDGHWSKGPVISLEELEHYEEEELLSHFEP